MASLIVSAKGGGSNFAIHPQQVVAARCTRIIDLGTQVGEYKGKPKEARKVVFQFETEVLMEDGEFAGKPFIVTNKYTASLSDKAIMRKDLESWRGRKFTPQELEQFDLKNVLGKACMINVVHSDPTADGKVYANISSIMPLPASMKANPASGELLFFTLSDFDKSVYDSLSDHWKEVIAKSPEYQEAVSGKPVKAEVAAAAGDIDDDEIPF